MSTVKVQQPLIVRSLDFQSFDEVSREVDRLRSQEHHAVGKWDLAQTCEHLALSMEGAFEDMPKMAPWPVRALVAPVYLRRIMKTRRMPTGVRAPDPLVPGESCDLDQAVKHLKKAMKAMETHSGEFRPHPFFGRLTPEQTRQFHLIHCAHHLSFLV